MQTAWFRNIGRHPTPSSKILPIQNCSRSFGRRFKRLAQVRTSITSYKSPCLFTNNPGAVEYRPNNLDHCHESQKERKLKEVLKGGGNCVLRKLQRRHHDREDGSSCDQVLGFFSQVEMKLVRRVLNMSRLSTDQLAWCSTKLSRINFARRTIYVEPSFLLFPC